MKRIKSIKQLKAEKARLKMHQAELEYKMHGNWAGLKEGLRPANIAKDTMGTILTGVSKIAFYKQGFVKGAIALGIGFLAKKMAARAGNKIKKVFTK